MNYTSRTPGFRKLSSDRERHDRNYIPRRFVGGQ